MENRPKPLTLRVVDMQSTALNLLHYQLTQKSLTLHAAFKALRVIALLWLLM